MGEMYRGDSMVTASLAYGIDDRPGPVRSVLFGGQHVLVMFAAMIAEPIILGTLLKLEPSMIQLMVSGAMLGCGVGALIQTRRIGFVGSGLPMVMGSFVMFVGPMVSIAKTSGLAAAFTALIIASLLQFLVVSFVIARLVRFFTPLVVGTSVTIVGLYVLPIGAGIVVGAGTPDQGAGHVFWLAGLTFVLVLVLNRFTRGIWKLSSLLIAIVAGYVVAALAGHVDFTAFEQAAWFGPPELMPFGGFEWPGITAIAILTFCFVVTAVDVVGLTAAYAGIVGVKSDEKMVRGAVAADGAASTVGSLFGGSPLISYSQNAGVIQLTGVGSRHVVATGGLILIVMAFSPKFGQLLVATPKPVLGAALMVTWGLLLATGTQIVRHALKTDRDVFLYAASVAIGATVILMPEPVVASLPQTAELFVRAGPAAGILAAFVLQAVLPAAREPDAVEPPADRDRLERPVAEPV